MSRPKTSDVLKAMDLAHRRKVRQDHDLHEKNKALVRDMCDQDLVDDVEPDPGVTHERPELYCGACGQLVPEPLLSCPQCFPEDDWSE